MAEILVINPTLECDRDFNADLFAMLDEIGISQTSVCPQETFDNPELTDSVDAIIISGVPYRYAPETAEQLSPLISNWLPATKTPVLGICLGHQAIGYTLGASIRRGIEVEHGLVDIVLSEEHSGDPLFRGLDNGFMVRSLHRASIDIRETKLVKLAESLPEPDTGTGCENLAVRLTDRPIYGVQFHPEQSGNVGKQILTNFINVAISRKRISSDESVVAALPC